jgi:hypothetical protein
MNYSRVNNITGWSVFLFALWVFVSTMEPTASFWDCGEFISCSYKLMAPHPPGAPIFLLIGRFFSLFAGDDVTQVAYWLNMVSAVSSAFTILFLFWSITMLAKKLVSTQDGTYNLGQTISIMGAGVIGATAYTFTDSFWFSAVESEVYAMSSFFTAAVFWAILKWEAHADEEDSDRWLILIAYLVGLSIGVHLLNLTAIPALALVFYFKKYKNTDLKGVFIALVVSVMLLGFVMVGVIPGIPSIAAKVELIFVNSFGMSFGSGIWFISIISLATLVYFIYKTHVSKNRLWNTSLVSFAFILIGYFSYGVIVIRSHYNPPIDMNDPENIMTFVSYLKREQYGDRPLLKGPNFTARPYKYEKTAPVYAPVTENGKDKYIIIDHKVEPKYYDKDMMLFPRMYSNQPGHPEQYQEWMRMKPGHKPTFAENISFMFTYQMGHMYWRYFMWNFAGRMGDEQDSGWIGVGQWSNIGDDLKAFASKARNNFYLLPLLAGMIGFSFQITRDNKNGWIVTSLFFFTGLAIIIYLNQPPTEPRERDYTFAASFYAFAIWIGLAVLVLKETIEKYVSKNSTIAASLATVLLVPIPAIMGIEGWDDHDRSQRFYQVESAKNLLNSCAPNAILFTGGDNDTYPLWYVQEVEGFRTDVRVCNLSLLNTDWYVKQMQNKAYLSEPLPISLTLENYRTGTNDYLYLDEERFSKNPNSAINLPVFIDLVKRKDPEVTRPYDGGMITTYPTQNFILPVDTSYVLKSGMVQNKYRELVTDKMLFSIQGGGMDKRSLVILDMIVTNQWKRPIYFSSTLSESDYLGMHKYLQQEGLAARLLPINYPGSTEGWIEPTIMYDNMMKFQFTNLSGDKIFYDENYHRFTINTKSQYYALAGQLLQEGDTTKARKAIENCFAKIQAPAIPYDYMNAYLLNLYFKIDKNAAYTQSKAVVEYGKKQIQVLKADKIKVSNRYRSYGILLKVMSDTYKTNGYSTEATAIDEFLENNNLKF